MKAILIDSREMDVREINIPIEGGDYAQIATAIGCDLFTVAQCIERPSGEPDTLFVDDEGLLHNPRHFFAFDGQPLAGNGLILGSTYDGDSADTTLSTDEVRGMVQWLTREQFAAALNAAYGAAWFVIVSAPDSQDIFNRD